MENEAAKNSAVLPLAQQISDMREHILLALAQIEDIELQINPHILADYQVKIGVWETKLLRTQIAARREKRKVELAQASVNTGTSPSEEALDAQLDEELSVWYAQLDSATASYHQALERRTMSEIMSPEATKEFKKLYRTLVKRLHPDIYPNDEERTYYFRMAQRAYEKGDIIALRSLEASTTHLEETPSTPDAQSEDTLNAELALLQAQAAVVDERLETLFQSEPYIFQSLLDDPIWVAQKVAQLKDALAQNTEELQRYHERFLSLMQEG